MCGRCLSHKACKCPCGYTVKPGDKPIQASAKKLGYRVCPDPACWHYLTPKKATREKAPIPVAATMPEEKPPELIA